jgi:hypothetical protein
MSIASVQGLRFPTQNPTPLPPGVLDPVLSGGPADPPPGTRYNGWTGMYEGVPHLMGGQVEHHHTPTPSRGVPQSLMVDGSLSLIESPVAQQVIFHHRTRD